MAAVTRSSTCSRLPSMAIKSPIGLILFRRVSPAINGVQSCGNFSTTSQLHADREYKLLIVGGGSAGCSIASKFSKQIKAGNGRMAILEPSKDHYYQSMFTLVGGGLRKFDETHRPTSSVIPKDCEWLEDKAKVFDPENHLVVSENGDTIKYDFLLVAMGLQLNYDKVKGLTEAIEKDPVVCSIYSPKYVGKVLPAIDSLTDGKAIFTFPDMPVKCPGAAQKICYLAEERIRKAVKRSQVQFHYNTTLPVIFPVPRYAQALEKFALSRDIVVTTKRRLIEVRGEECEAIFQVVGESRKTETFKYAMLHVTPPMTTPRELWNTPLVDDTTFVNVDKETLQHVKYKNVFAIGDCANTPTPKTAAAVAAQIGVVSKNLELVMNNKEPERKYNGYTSCPFFVSSSKVILAEFGYDQKIMETFWLDQTKPRYSMFLLTANLVPHIYWKLMLKGWWHGPSFIRKMLRLGL